MSVWVHGLGPFVEQVHAARVDAKLRLDAAAADEHFCWRRRLAVSVLGVIGEWHSMQWAILARYSPYSTVTPGSGAATLSIGGP